MTEITDFILNEERFALKSKDKLIVELEKRNGNFTIYNGTSSEVVMGLSVVGFNLNNGKLFVEYSMKDPHFIGEVGDIISAKEWVREANSYLYHSFYDRFRED